MHDFVIASNHTIMFLIIVVLGITFVDTGFGQSSNSTSIVKIARTTNNSPPLPQYFNFYQSEHETVFTNPSNTYLRVPGLSFTVYHAQPAVYELKFQATCGGLKTWTCSFRHFMVDGRILISNYLLPNNDQRPVVAPELGTNIHVIDSRDGGVFANGGLDTYFYSSCDISDIIHLSPGIHAIDVVVRTQHMLRVVGGVFSVKLTQYSTAADINLSTPTIK